MSMYLPNPDLSPTGFEPAEYIDPEQIEQGERSIDTHWAGATDQHRPLSDQTRTNITRWAQEYISGLVRDHDGDEADVRSVVHELHLQSMLADDA